MPGTLPFSANEVQNYPGTTPDALSGDMTVLMKTNRYYIDGSLLTTNSTYTVTKAWGRVAVERGWASDYSHSLPVADTPAGITNALYTALVDAYDAGLLAVPLGTRLGTIAGVPTASILLDAGVGGTVSSARVTFAPPTDTIGAQRLHTPTEETYTLTMDSAIVIRLGDLDGIALTMHAIGISVDAVLTSEVYVAESDYTLAEYITGDARFEWLDSTPTRVRLTLQRGSSTRYAMLSVVAEVSA